MSSSVPLPGHGSLSVVVPCYNEAATLAVVVDQVLASPYTGEVIKIGRAHV